MTLHSRNRRKHQRGVTLLEGLMSSLILLAGLVGVMQGIIYASRQNSTANKMTRAGAVATQIRSSLMAQGADRLDGTNGLFANCSADATILSYTDGMGSVTDVTPCVADIDAFDTTNTDMTREIMPGYSTADGALYKRVAVRFRNGTTTVGAAVVVSWLDNGVRRFHHQYVSFYPTANFKGIDL